MRSFNSFCTLCEPGYLLREGVCHEALNVLRNSCFSLKADGTEQSFMDLECISCNVSHFPINMENNYICIRDVEIEYYGNLIKNCHSFSYNTQS